MSPTLSAMIALAALVAPAFLVLTWSLPREREALSLAALLAAAAAAAFAILVTGLEHVTAIAASTGDSIDLLQQERILRWGYSLGIPRLVGVSLLLVVAAASHVAAVRTTLARVLSVALVVSLLAPAGWLGTRGIGLHDRTMREMCARPETAQEVGPDPCNDARTAEVAR